jgi:hypothetical protein
MQHFLWRNNCRCWVGNCFSQKTNIIPNVTAECRAMLLFILELSSLDLDPETFYSNRNPRSFCLVHVGSFWHRNLKLARTNFLYTYRLCTTWRLVVCFHQFLRFAKECLQSWGHLWRFLTRLFLQRKAVSLKVMEDHLSSIRYSIFSTNLHYRSVSRSRLLQT